ncbi:MAG: hypothetical protein HOP03_13885 [Lysobacter sp.]|nr:hypothetical protein [Lysobacter sp.]
MYKATPAGGLFCWPAFRLARLWLPIPRQIGGRAAHARHTEGNDRIESHDRVERQDSVEDARTAKPPQVDALHIFRAHRTRIIGKGRKFIL